MARTIIFFALILMSTAFAAALSGSIHIPEEYGLVAAGKSVYFDMDIKFPENKDRVDMQFEYTLYDKEKNKIAQATSVKAIETQISFIDHIVVPENTPKGLTTLSVRIYDYNGTNEEVETTFYTTGNVQESINIYYIVLLVVTLFVGILVGIDIMVHRRQNQL